MWYWILNIAIGVWVLNDARNRKVENSIGWALGTCLLMIIFLPYYLAKRNLKAGEIREGGTAWNLIKSFAVFWTLLMAASGIAGMVSAGNAVNSASSGAEQTGAAIGTALGLGMIGGLWFVVLVGALVLGLFLKKSSQVEKGPTGALASDSTSGNAETIAWK
jgi:hypothetical protein